MLAPLLFLFVIDSLRSRLPRGLFISKYADDVALWASSHGLEYARGLVERGVAEVLQWSREKKLQLSTEKCVVSFFSTNPYEANYEPVLVVEGKQLKFQAEPEPVLRPHIVLPASGPEGGL